MKQRESKTTVLEDELQQEEKKTKFEVTKRVVFQLYLSQNDEKLG